MALPFEKMLQQPTPRYLDVYSQLVVLFSGFLQQMGWAFLGFGMIFVAIFLPMSDWKNALDWGGWDTIEGTILEARGTSSYVNEQQVWEYGYTFPFMGEDRAGRAYAYAGDFSVGQTVAVHFKPNRPRISKIDGARSGVFPKFVIFVLIFPLAGLGMVIPGLRKQARALDLLRNGTFARGKLQEKTATGTTITINKQVYPQYRYVFQFQYQGQTYEAVTKTHITEPVEDEAEEAILFYPGHPSFNTVYDGISNAPEMDPMGNFLPLNWKKVAVFLGPAFAVLITTLAVLLLL